MSDININSLTISPLMEEELDIVRTLIKTSLSEYDQSATTINATLRRLEHFILEYSKEGAQYLVARDPGNNNAPIAGAGIGPLHGLPLSEGMGELRDVFVSSEYRGLGLGAKIIKTCVDKSKTFGYNKLYLETTPQMSIAKKLFLRSGFRPITDSANSENTTSDEPLASYFIMEDLQDS
jgi:putative acetyltransferase